MPWAGRLAIVPTPRRAAAHRVAAAVACPRRVARLSWADHGRDARGTAVAVCQRPSAVRQEVADAPADVRWKEVCGQRGGQSPHQAGPWVEHPPGPQVAACVRQAAHPWARRAVVGDQTWRVLRTHKRQVTRPVLPRSLGRRSARVTATPGGYAHTPARSGDIVMPRGTRQPRAPRVDVSSCRASPSWREQRARRTPPLAAPMDVKLRRVLVRSYDSYCKPRVSVEPQSSFELQASGRGIVSPDGSVRIKSSCDGIITTEPSAVAPQSGVLSRKQTCFPLRGD